MMNFAWLSRTSRFAAVSLAVASGGAFVWTGCGSDSSAPICDDAGLNCMVCDGYGCSAVGSTTIDAGVDTGIDTGVIRPHTPHSDAGPKSKPDANTGTKHDAGSDVAKTPACGGTNGPCACTTTSECATGQVCQDGSCEAASSVCTYSSDCGGSEVCANGECLNACSQSAPCNDGFTCTDGVCEPNASTSTCSSNADCQESAPYCVAGTCSLACTADSNCPSGDYCDQGACVLDTRPSPDCTGNSDCLSNQVCESGYCLYSCTDDNQCQLIDHRFTTCTDNVCREVSANCLSQSDCMAGQSCINNQCE
jgi:hypothetical protein